MKNLDLSIFPKADKHSWLQLAKDQLKGTDPIQELRWESSGINNLQPYYDQGDVASLEYLSNFFGAIAPHRWKLYESIHVADASSGNKKALEALMGGCDGVIFHLNQDTNLTQLLKDINLDICDVSIFSKRAFEMGGFSGMIKNNERSNCVVESASHNSPIEQLVDILTQLDHERFVSRTAFKDFFLEIATVRALRYLLSEEKQQKDIHIHTFIPRHESDEFQWFLNTTSGLASILGGSHSIALTTAMGEDRITRNVGNLIRDESGINMYEDQCGGSYYVDVLADQIIQLVKNELN